MKPSSIIIKILLFSSLGPKIVTKVSKKLDDKKDTANISSKLKSVGFGASNLDHLKNCLQDSSTIKDTNDQSSSSSGSQTEIVSECLFHGHSCPYASRVPPLKRRYNHINGLCGVSDVDVICDGCEVHTVDRPRPKSKLKYDNDLCSICSEEMGQDVDIRMDLPVISRRSSHLNAYHDQVDLILPIVPNAKKDPDVPNTDIAHGNELCENTFIGVVETEDHFFNAKSHKDKQTNLPIKNISLIGNASVSKSNSDPAPKALEVPNVVQSPSSIDPFEGLEDLGIGNTNKNNEGLRIHNYHIEPIDLYQIYFQNAEDF